MTNEISATPHRRVAHRPIGLAKDVADRLDEAADGPQADQCAEPQQRAGSRGKYVADWLAQQFADIGRQDMEERIDGPYRLFALPEQRQHGGGDDEERKHRHQRQIGQVAGIHEAIGVDADPGPLEDAPGISERFDRGRRRFGIKPFLAMEGAIFGRGRGYAIHTCSDA
jgi:hypothetical protein